MYSLKDGFKIRSIRISLEHCFFPMQLEKTGSICVLWWHSGAGNSRESGFMWIKLVSLWLHLAMLELLCSLLPSPFLLGCDVVGRASPRKTETKESRLGYSILAAKPPFTWTQLEHSPASRNNSLCLIKKTFLWFWQKSLWFCSHCTCELVRDLLISWASEPNLFCGHYRMETS